LSAAAGAGPVANSISTVSPSAAVASHSTRSASEIAVARAMPPSSVLAIPCTRTVSHAASIAASTAAPRALLEPG
jgi:hypothetical protein